MSQAWYAIQRSEVDLPVPTRALYKKTSLKRQRGATLDQVVNVASTDLLSGIGVDAASFCNMVKEARLFNYMHGETVVEQGELVPYLNIVVQGNAILKTISKGTQYELYRLGRGDFFGETTLLSGSNSPYSAFADGDLQVLCLPASDVSSLLAGHPSLSNQIGRIMSERTKAIADLEKIASH